MVLVHCTHATYATRWWKIVLGQMHVVEDSTTSSLKPLHISQFLLSDHQYRRPGLAARPVHGAGSGVCSVSSELSTWRSV